MIWRELVRFAIAGAAGFIADASILYAALSIGLGLYVGRAVSFLAAVWVTWQINRSHTFSAGTGKSAWHEWLHYLLAMSVGGLVNYATYCVALKFLSSSALLPMYSVAIGSMAGMLVNFATAKWWVFKRKSGCVRPREI
jgi:putative flippase GtrA